MKLNCVEVDRSPLDSTKVRLRGKLSIQRDAEDIEVWFDVDDGLAVDLATSGAPWLLAMIPYAAEHGGTIEIDLPTDTLLVENATMSARVYRKWFPFLKPYNIAANRQVIATGATKSVSFFSGGIDGMHTALRHSPLAGGDQVGVIDELLMVWGFDVDLDSPMEFANIFDKAKRFSERLGVPIRCMATNIRRPNTYWRRLWGPLSHTLGRSACAHALEGRYKSAVWGSNFLAEDSLPGGSHPWTDQYNSSTSLKTWVDGNAHSRMDKIVFLSRFPWTLENVHVCYHNMSSGNCGACIKCIRSAIAIDLVGLTGACRSLSLPVPHNVIRNAYCGGISERTFFTEMLEYARKVDRKDVEESISIALRRSQYMKPVMAFAQWSKGKPAIWRFGRMFSRAIDD